MTDCTIDNTTGPCAHFGGFIQCEGFLPIPDITSDMMLQPHHWNRRYDFVDYNFRVLLECLKSKGALPDDFFVDQIPRIPNNVRATPDIWNEGFRVIDNNFKKIMHYFISKRWERERCQKVINAYFS